MDTNTYRRWLKAAYLYYRRPGEDTGMDDYTWDHFARELYKNRTDFPPADFPVLHDPRWEGGSLYWMKESDYPDWAKAWASNATA